MWGWPQELVQTWHRTQGVNKEINPSLCPLNWHLIPWRPGDISQGFCTLDTGITLTPRPPLHMKKPPQKRLGWPNTAQEMEVTITSLCWHPLCARLQGVLGTMAGG